MWQKIIDQWKAKLELSNSSLKVMMDILDFNRHYVPKRRMSDVSLYNETSIKQ